MTPRRPQKSDAEKRLIRVEKFWARIDIDGADDCWHWKPSVNTTGYGQFKFDGKMQVAHRVSYQIVVGPVPEGMYLDHTCHNVDLSCKGGLACLHRRCVNPAHLEPVTNLENIRRGRAGLYLAERDECVNGHSLVDPSNVRLATHYAGGTIYRKCMSCSAENSDRAYRNRDVEKWRARATENARRRRAAQRARVAS